METADNNFDDIRPYADAEVPAVIADLLKNKDFMEVLEYIFPKKTTEEIVANWQTIKSIHDFQYGISVPTVLSVIRRTSTSIDFCGYEQLQKNQAYTFISNHRDIVVDAAVLSTMLAHHGHDTVEIAIGDNLLLRPWVKDLVRLNKSFIVKRSVEIRQMLEVSMHLSRYIHHTVGERKQSVWIAQREGRAKNSDDHTQESVIKMLAMGGDSDFLSNIKALNITPLSISYEYDPCDYLKAKEYQQKRDQADYKKAYSDDLLNMQTGILTNKGRIWFQIGQPIGQSLEQIPAGLPRNELVKTICRVIDREIFRNYHFYPINYIAYDRLWGGNRFAAYYTATDIATVDNYWQQQLAKIDLQDKDLPFLTEKILEMYANPLKNAISG
ncbi:MAG: 1-acyl-sn-glycerol-3-phosphate acyltransferase [Candidatus Symbiothrix sp.]|jgi:hypothetical protein|nr:1-acyl-sn-glycerol-3-phosphate acyltransferase [Candidatus Symbiothrix sp.]